MLNFRRDLFFVKFAVLFFLITLFGYWGIDLNSEEVYIAFSFFFLVILAFVSLRLSILSMFVGLANRRYARIVQEGIIAAYVAKIVGTFWKSPLNVILFVNKNYGFFVTEVVSAFGLRASLLKDFNRVRFSFLQLIVGVVNNFFLASITRFLVHVTFSSSLSKIFVVEV